MKNKRITSKDWFSIEESAYFASASLEYLIIRDQDPWLLYFRKCEQPFHDLPALEGSYTFEGGHNWMPADIDGKRLERYMKRYATPETWEEVSRKFVLSHEVHLICDGPCLSIVNKRADARRKRMGYLMHSFPEAWHPSYQKAMQLWRFLEGVRG